MLNDVLFEQSLQTEYFGRNHIFLETVSSTNDYLSELSAEKKPHGTIVATNFQSAGKGRLGRRWLAPAGSSLLFSTQFGALANATFPPTWLTMVAGLAAVQAIQSVCQIEMGLKWPNDIVYLKDEQLYKMGGILLEAQFVNNQLQSAIVGMGINVNIRAADLPDAATPATSLLTLLGRKVERERLLAEILGQMEQLMLSIEAGRAEVVKLWERRLVTIGRNVSATGTTTITGVATGVDDWGRLQIRTDDGNIHAIAAGDVTLRTT